MKKQLLSFALLLSACFFSANAYAQCTPPTVLDSPGIYQDGNICFYKGVYMQQVWQFQDLPSFNFHGTIINLDSLSIDTIVNLPAGLHWTTSKKDYVDGAGTARPNLFHDLDYGCFLVSGQTSDDTGNYKLDILVHVWVHNQGDLYEKLSYIGDTLYLKVVDSGAVCTLDSSATALTSSDGGVSGEAPYYTGINNVAPVIGNMANNPNPFNATTQIIFGATESKQVTFKVFDLIGNTLHEEQIGAVTGNNTINFSRKGISSGLYFYSITDGKQIYTNKMVITD